MDKAESKYFNTARLMDEALLLLLEQKDIDDITVKEICKKAGVNRSTFYLHYETIYDLLAESLEMLNERFQKPFLNMVSKPIEHSTKEEVMFIKEEFIKPYLSFVKENKRVFKTIHEKPQVFNVSKTYTSMYNKVFAPILNKFNVPKNEEPYRFAFYTMGVAAIIEKWVERNCADSIDIICALIIDCVNLDQSKLK